MDAKDYLIKVNEICTAHEGIGCSDNTCPIHKYACGLPRESGDINPCIELVEHWEEKTYPFGRCRSCNKEFNSELKFEYQIKFCPWCGATVDSQ